MGFDAYVDRHELHQTDYDRIWWHFENPDHWAFKAAQEVAAAFPDLTIVGTELRVWMLAE